MNDPKYYYLLDYLEFKIEQDKLNSQSDIKQLNEGERKR